MTVAAARSEEDPGPEMVSVSAAAKRLGVSPKTIRRAIDGDELRTYRFGSTRVVRLRLSEVDALMKPTRPGGAP